MTELVRIVRAGDSSIVAEFPERIDPEVNARCISLAETLGRLAIPGVRDVVPTFRTVAVYFDPLQTDLARLHSELTRAAESVDSGVRPATTSRRVPVCYGGEFGPDLPEVAAAAHLTEGQVVAIHTTTVYRVFMLGFAPGFAYLGVVDQRIAVPRRAVPRTRVPAGSVGIAGMQTGIYPADTPGGWQLVGRTPQMMFDPRRHSPSLLQPGDQVQFFAIDAAEWDRFAS